MIQMPQLRHFLLWQPINTRLQYGYFNRNHYLCGFNLATKRNAAII